MGTRGPSILLVNPSAVAGVRGFAPLSVATIAGITPNDFHVDIWDEDVSGPLRADGDLPRRYDIVGVSVTFPYQSTRALKIVRDFQARGALTVLGGAFPTSDPTQFRGRPDVLIIGEAEELWPRFLCDWTAGDPQREYRQITPPDITFSPPANWDTLAKHFGSHYLRGSVQTTRGCPFDCEFCDVIYIYGRQQRHKAIETVITELEQQHAMGVRTIFLADDAFDADPKYAKQLMEEVIRVNASKELPLAFEVQCGINVARSAEFLTMLADSNFELLWMGIESPNRGSLVSINKLQNTRRDLATDCRKIGSYGIGIAAYMIVGIDEDDLDIFEQHIQFWRDASILVPIVNVLTAVPHTKLWMRLAREGRLLLTPGAQEGLFDITSNIVPKKMSRRQLIEGYRHVLEHAADWAFFVERLLAWLDGVERIPQISARPPSDTWVRAQRDRLVGGDQAVKYFDEVIAYTKRCKPMLLTRVLSYLATHDHRARALTDLHLLQLSRVINSRALDRRAIVTTWRVPVPAGFRAAFRAQILPRAYARAVANLADAAALPEVLTKIFTDFLIRFAHEFGEFQPAHERLLDELTDKVCGEVNGVRPEQFVASPPSDEPVNPRVLNQLSDSLMKAIAEDLIQRNPSLHRPERQPVHLG